MRQYDIFDNPSREMRTFAPYLVNLQSHHLHDIESIIVAPLVIDGYRPLTSVDVPVNLGDELMVVGVAELSAMFKPASTRRRGSLAHYEDDIRRALEKLFSGF